MDPNPNKTEHHEQKKSRKEVNTSISHMVLNHLFDEWILNTPKSPGDPLLPYHKINEIIRRENLLPNKDELDRRTLIRICTTILDFASQVMLAQRGLDTGPNTYFQNNLLQAREEKEKIAERFLKLFLKLLPPDEYGKVSIDCSPGTVVCECIRQLITECNRHTLITNNLGIIDMSRGTGTNNIILTGGEYISDIHGLVGDKAIQGFDKIRCEVGLIGVSGVSYNGDLYVRYSQEVPVLEKIIGSVNRYLFIVAQAQKLATTDTFKVTSIKEILKTYHNINIYFITTPPTNILKKNDKKKQDVDHDKKKADAEHVLTELRNMKSTESRLHVEMVD